MNDILGSVHISPVYLIAVAVEAAGQDHVTGIAELLIPSGN